MNADHEEKNKQLALLLGWTDLAYAPSKPSLDVEKGSQRCLVGKPEGSDEYQPVPDFCGDLNQIHLIEPCLTLPQRYTYYNLIQGGLVRDVIGDLWACLHASAQEKASALISILTKE